jgi:uncharacterized protein YukE
MSDDKLGVDTGRLHKSADNFDQHAADLASYVNDLDSNVARYDGVWGTTSTAKEFESHYKPERDDFMTRMHALVQQLKATGSYVKDRADSFTNAGNTAGEITSVLPIDIA